MMNTLYPVLSSEGSENCTTTYNLGLNHVLSIDQLLHSPLELRSSSAICKRNGQSEAHLLQAASSSDESATATADKIRQNCRGRARQVRILKVPGNSFAGFCGSLLNDPLDF
mmetsp:Transcript_71373/g.155502  ORF Transcript_71373/g.155502 Transcript_71373/m.155502 type:complete len:112 (+) Transcript_71373:206-541(+)